MTKRSEQYMIKYINFLYEDVILTTCPHNLEQMSLDELCNLTDELESQFIS